MRNLIHIYLDGNQWCAIYPMGSNLMECKAVAFADSSKLALQKLKDENELPTHSFYCEQ